MRRLPSILSPTSKRADLTATPTVVVPPSNVWEVNGVTWQPSDAIPSRTPGTGPIEIKQVQAVPGQVTQWTGAIGTSENIIIHPLVGSEVVVSSDLTLLNQTFQGYCARRDNAPHRQG